jgi:2-furoate---CoA ligase
MDLGTLFEFAVERFPNYVAVVKGEKRYTYREFNDQIDQLATGFQKIGVSKQDRVMVLLKNHLELVMTYWACQKLGAIFTPLNFRLSAGEIEYCVNDAEPKVIIFEDVNRNAISQIKTNQELIFVNIDSLKSADMMFNQLFLIGRSHTFVAVPVNESDISIILYTSGTTGKPKGVPRTHKNEYSASMAHNIHNQYVHKESTLGVMPLYHTMGVKTLISMVILNGKYVLLPEFDPEISLKIIQKEKISCVYLVPTLYHDILYHPHFHHYDLSCLKKIGYAGAAMPTILIQKCFQNLKPEVFINHYGSTEVYTISINHDVASKPTSTGKPGIHSSFRLVTPNPDGLSTPDDIVIPGEVGEIITDIKNPEAFQGYWNRPDATNKAIRDGWYFSGDLGFVDKGGDLFVVGRIDDMIISGGENIHPLEVEDILAEHPKVLEAAVVGEADNHWGQKVCAYIVPKDPSLTMEELDQHCKLHLRLSNFKRPKKYVFLSNIPKSLVGKTLRRKLKEGDFQKI